MKTKHTFTLEEVKRLLREKHKISPLDEIEIEGFEHTGLRDILRPIDVWCDGRKIGNYTVSQDGYNYLTQKITG